MQHPPGGERGERYRALAASARAIGAPASFEAARTADGADLRRDGRRIGALVAAVALGVPLWRGSLPAPLVVRADPGADSQLFQLTNQDRTSNGLGPYGYLGSLQNIGESWAYRCSGITVHGRADDMLQRNYFSHVIQGCGQYVFSMMNAYPVSYQSAGENIAWSSGFGSASASVSYTNNAFMNSPDHRANILSTAFTAMGVGSGWESGPWTGSGGSLSNVSMFAELFVQQGSAPPPPTRPPAPRPPTAPPGPQPASTAAPTPEPRNEPAPTPSLPVPVATEVPTPEALGPQRPRVDLTLRPPAIALTPAAPPLELLPGGSLSDGIDAVLLDLLLG